MDILKKSLAPITDEAWEEINKTASEILTSVLSARKFVDVTDPKGLDFGGVHTGRIDVVSNKNDEVRYGLNQIKPLVEVRVPFDLDLWELDNASRGAEDIDLSALEDAACKIATFEEKAIYHGLEKAGIEGIKNQSEKVEKFPEKSDKLLSLLSTQLAIFKQNGIEGPYSLVVNANEWERLAGQGDGYPLRKQLKQLLEGKIILSPFIEEGFLVSERKGDFRLTIGQDLSIGFNYSDQETVQLYFTESFTFQCFEPAAAVVFSKNG